MKEVGRHSSLGHDDKLGPLTLLGLDQGAAPEEIRAAYLQLIYEHPPDKDPQAFERIRDAYDLLCDPIRRVDRMMSTVDPERPLVDLLGDENPRCHVGPDPWLKAIEGH